MTTTDTETAARSARLRYVSDARPGIRRERCGDHFIYVAPDGSEVRDAEDLVRIRAIAIPPAWTDVWICPHRNGHIQATGRDAKGRKQYRYHARWRQVREESKYESLLDFGRALPAIRERVDRDLRRHGLPMPKVLATVVRLLETTLIRVGNREYARSNGSFGLTTMRDRHVQFTRSSICFTFVGKGGKKHEVRVGDRRLSRIVQRCRDIPGYELFQYLDDDGERRSVDASDVNEYLHEITGREFTAKDFRTWSATVMTAEVLQRLHEDDPDGKRERHVKAAIEEVAEALGNTTTICRKSYIHPRLLEAYVEGDLIEQVSAMSRRKTPEGLDEEEGVVLHLLERWTNEG